MLCFFFDFSQSLYALWFARGYDGIQQKYYVLALCKKKNRYDTWSIRKYTSRILVKPFINLTTSRGDCVRSPN